MVPREQVLAFLHPLPVGALWGVGEKTAQSLERLGLRTVGDLAQAPPETLRHSLGNAAGSHLYALAWGRDPRAVQPYDPEKSIGAEETFGTDVADPRWSARSCCGCPSGSPPGCAGRRWWGAPSRSSCATRTSRPSAARAP